MTLGGQTVTFISVTGSGTYDSLGVEATTRTEVDVMGCHHRPLRAEETPEWLTNIATQIWKTTAPPEAAALAADANGELEVDGIAYHVIAGAQPFTDLSGRVRKVTILSRKQEA
jgi:hypothetical protein